MSICSSLFLEYIVEFGTCDKTCDYTFTCDIVTLDARIVPCLKLFL